MEGFETHASRGAHKGARASQTEHQRRTRNGTSFDASYEASGAVFGGPVAVRPRSTDSGVAWRRRPAQDGRTPERSLATRSRRAVALHARVELWRPRLSALQKTKSVLTSSSHARRRSRLDVRLHPGLDSAQRCGLEACLGGSPCCRLPLPAEPVRCCSFVIRAAKRARGPSSPSCCGLVRTHLRAVCDGAICNLYVLRAARAAASVASKAIPRNARGVLLEGVGAPSLRCHYAAKDSGCLKLDASSTRAMADVETLPPRL